MEPAQNNTNTPSNNYFIFPGLRELLIGISVLAGLEYLFGESPLDALSLQQIFLAILALIILASTITIIGTTIQMVYIQTKHGKALEKWFNDL